MTVSASSPGTSSSAPRRAKNTTKLTATTKAHRFEPFSKRISKLKIDPAHKITRERPVEDDVSLSKPCFRSALEHWNEFNLSQNFTDFAGKVNLLSESLPQLLHHADSIHGLLVDYIGKRDILSLEPLLDLVAQFAHDLGQHFEKYFSPVVTLVTSVAATHEAPEVIEWSFTCLAWIFKFLSRLLVPDLRPVLSIMSTYLGKSRQKDFVKRFAAESVAFLLRKAAIVYPKKRAPLDNVISCLMQDLSEITNEHDLQSYQTGLMALFSEAAKGVDGALHSSAPDLVRCLLEKIVIGTDLEKRGLQVLEGCLINAIHQSDAQGFRPLLAVLEQYAMLVKIDTPAFGVSVAVKLLFAVIGARRGSRIESWSGVSKALLHLHQPVLEIGGSVGEIQRDFLTALAMTLQYAPMSELLPFASSLSDVVVSTPDARNFFSFCHFFDSIGRERFQSFFLQKLQSFIVSRWRDDQSGLCLLLNALHESGTIGPNSRKVGEISCPIDWETSILNGFAENLVNDNTEFDVQLHAFAELVDCISFPHDKANRASLERSLHQSLLHALDFTTPLSRTGRIFALGRGFRSYVKLGQSLNGRCGVDVTMARLLCKASDSTLRMLPFLQGFSEYLEAISASVNLADDCFDSLRTRLINNLSHRNTEIRVATLLLLQKVAVPSETWANTSITLALEIQSTSYTLQNVRRLSMSLRRLSHVQKEIASSSTWQRMIPLFFCGLLSTFRGQPAEDVCLAIAEMCNGLDHEEAICDVIDKWLQSPISSQHLPSDNDNEELTHHSLTAFQCSNIIQAKKLSVRAAELYGNPGARTRANFEEVHRSEPNGPPAGARSFALRILKAAPAFAEKRSRLFVPIFLDAHPMRDTYPLAFNSTESTTSHTLNPEVPESSWSYADRKAFLELLAKFTNPKVLYRSNEVYDVLLTLLSNGNSEIQRLALKAIFSWKHPSVRPYEERLLRLLDEKTLRDELAVVFHTDQEQNSIEATHRAQLLPILLRLLFGQMISHSGTHGGQESKRKAILRTLFRLQEVEVLQFLGIAFGSLATVNPIENRAMRNDFASHDVIPLERQYGLLRMVEAMMETLQSQISPYGAPILNPVLYCTIRGCRHVGDFSLGQPASALARSIRKVGLNCLNMLFQHGKNIEWSMYLSLIFQEIIRPRMATFAIETAQGVSGLLKLFSTWSASMEYLPYLHLYDNSLLDTIHQCLTVPSAKDEVKIFVLEQIVSNLARLATNSPTGEDPATIVLKAHMPSLAHHLMKLVDTKPSRKVLDEAVDVLSQLANLVQSSKDAGNLLRSLVLALREPSERISPWTKGNLLKSMRQLLLLHLVSIDADTVAEVYETVTPLFNYFKDAPNRASLVDLIYVLSSNDSSLHEIAKLCSDLNAYSSTKLDEVDFDVRLEAFQAVKELDLTCVTPAHYQPILYNILYFARAEDDFAVRSSAVSSLRHFIKTCSSLHIPGFNELIKTILLPALKRGIKENSETTLADQVTLFGSLIQYHQDNPQLADMRGLLVGDDEEASFFNNILHIQSQRRQRAMRRLADEAEKGTLHCSNISTYFLPLLEKFIFDIDTDVAASNLKGHAILASGTLFRWIEWNQFKAIFRRYKGYLETKSEAEKDVSRLLSVASDALVLASGQATPDLSPTASRSNLKPCYALSHSLPSQSKLIEELTTNFIPALTTLFHHKDESQMSLRLPVAVTAAKLMKLLPEDQMGQFLPPVLLDLSYILRSRVQISRDSARRTLSEVVTVLGPSCLQYILNELRTSLARGYQLHVLSYTVHSILKSMEPVLSAGELDFCLHSLVSIVMDDIFGMVGREKENEDYVSQMKEVKSSKSLDTMEMLARNVTLRNLSKIIRPLQTLLTGPLNSKQSKKVDDLLLRIGRGLSGNPSAGSRDLLVFSYEIIQDLYRQMQPPDPRTITNDQRNRQRFLVQLSGANKTTQGSNSPMLYKLARFALDIVSLTLKQHDDLRTPENVHGFLPVIGDALMQAPDEVKTSALRLLSTVVNLRIPDLDQNASLFILEAVSTIKSTVSTNGELAQAALKVVTSILRERKDVMVKDADVAYLIHRIAPDLEEPSRQGVTFNFVKAVMARKFILPEVYDLADRIGIMMVTNHDRTARDMARGIYVHFLLHYPQKESRWAKQIKFLVKNLDYKYPEGRQSVMEAVNALLAKADDSNITQELVESFFMPVVLLMSNDEESKCREMAGALLSTIFHKSDGKHMKSLLGPLRSWTDQIENLALTALGIQAYKICVESQALESEREISFLLEGINRVLRLEDDNNEESWKAIYYALQLFTSITLEHPSLTMVPTALKIWSPLINLVSHPHIWVQTRASSLIGLWFTDIAKQQACDGYGALPRAASHGLPLNAETMIQLLHSSVRVLRRNIANTDLSRQTLFNLAFLGRCFNSNEVLINVRKTSALDSAAEAGADESGSDSDSGEEGGKQSQTQSIPAIQYLLHQLSSILRHEPPKLTVQTLLPKQSALDLFNTLLPHTALFHLLPTLQSILTPLHHLTDPSIPGPRNAAEDFQTAYAALTSSAEEVLQTVQKRVGDVEYVRARTEVSRQVRERREGRRTKRRIERVAEPEKVAREKRKKNERKVIVKRERAAEGRGRRRGW
jgi:U3 small nucleolar RNA-associated protein 20